MKLNKFVCLFVTGQKSIFCVFLRSRSMSKKYGLGRDQKSKNIVSFRVQRSKEHGPGWNQKSKKDMISFWVQKPKSVIRKYYIIKI